VSWRAQKNQDKGTPDSSAPVTKARDAAVFNSQPQPNKEKGGCREEITTQKPRLFNRNKKNAKRHWHPPCVPLALFNAATNLPTRRPDAEFFPTRSAWTSASIK
jgi:hypothetical protein